MKVFWKVHISNFDYFIEYISKKYRLGNPDLKIFKTYYRDNKYLYLCVEKADRYKYLLAYADDNDFSRNWFSNDGWVYKGEYLSRMEKLETLNKVSNRL